MFNLLVTARSFGYSSRRGIEALSGLPGLTFAKPEHIQAFNEAEMCSLIGDYDGLIVGTDAVSAKVIASGQRLKIIAKHGVGVDNIDLKAATRAGIVVTNLPGMNEKTVAEMTMGLAIALLRQICAGSQQARAGNFQKYLSHDLWGKTIGVIGTGRIGLEVIRRARAFDMHVLAYDALPNSEAALAFGFQYVGVLEDLVRQADIITLHVPLTPQTKGLIDGPQIAIMKPGAVVINTARAGIVDETALVQALRDGRIAGAALDVFSARSLEHKDALALPNLIITPHVAAYTYETLEGMDMAIVGQFETVLRGEIPASQLNPAVTRLRD